MQLDTAPVSHESQSLAIKVIRRRLATEIVGCHIYLFGVVPSTNAVLRRLAEAGQREGTVVLTEEQRDGRGRRGQPWFSPSGVNLYASVLFRPADLAVDAVDAFSHIAALALTDAIGAEGLRATIREPNDVLVGGGKVAGILVESASRDGRVEFVILGVGVNVNVTRATLAEALGEAADGATSLRESGGRPIDRNALAAGFLNALERWFEVYGREGAAAVVRAWRSRARAATRLPGPPVSVSFP